MNTPKNAIKHPLLKIAVLSVLAGGSLALGQTRVNRSGANDANNRVGSYGVNSVNTAPNPWEISNAIVNGNVTGGQQFRGRVETGDTFAFRGNTADAVSDRFIRGSSGVTTSGVLSNNSSNTTLFYGNSRAAPPPPNIASSLVQNGPGGAYTPPTPQSWTTVDPRQQSLSSPISTTFATGSMPPGTVDAAIAPNAFAAAALTGNAQSDYTNINPDSTVSQLTPGQVSRIRGQVPGDQTAPGDQPLNDSVPSAQPSSSAIKSQGLNDSVASPSMSNALTPMPGNEPGMVNKVVGASDDATTTGLPQQRGDQAQRPGQAAVDAAQKFDQDLKARKAAADKAKATDQPAPGAKGAKPDAVKPDATPAGKGNAMNGAGNGLANGSAESSGVDALIKKAEDQMRQGKFASAIDTYDTAESIAPKNGLIKLGRTNAELGGSYYRRAEMSLKQTLVRDHSLLASQSDLRAYMGDDRLAIVQKDLSDLVQKNPDDTNAAVLLAYVYYNTGNERRAAALLDLADKRAGGRDDFITLLKSSWNLGGGADKK